MNTKARRILGIVTTVGIAGVVVYSVKKYYDSKKQDEQSIDIEEAKKMVADDERKVENQDENEAILKGVNAELSSDLIEDVREYPVGHAYHNKPHDFMKEDRPIAVKKEDLKPPVAEEEEEEEEAFYEGPDPQEIQDSKGYFEEDKDVIDDLRYEPNSVEAREQFINMELANLGRDNDTRDVVAMLYDHPFVPTCDEDQNLKTRLMDHRIKFFGLVSKWTREVSFGDVVIYYAKASEYNCGNDVFYWADYFLTCANLNDIMLTSQDIHERLVDLNGHSFYNEDTQSFGLFGLSHEQMNEAISVAHKRVDEKVTYDIEFHQFVQGAI